MGMTVGWAKNWAGTRVCYSFGVERKAWSPCPGLCWQREGALQGGIWQQQGWSLAIWVEFRTIRGWGQSCFLLILPFSPDPSSPSPIIFSPLSLVSSPNPAEVLSNTCCFHQKHPSCPLESPVLSSMNSHIYTQKPNFQHLSWWGCIKITRVTSSKLWFKQDRWKMPCWPNAH